MKKWFLFFCYFLVSLIFAWSLLLFPFLDPTLIELLIILVAVTWLLWPLGFYEKLIAEVGWWFA